MNDDIKTLSNMIDDEHGGFYGQMTGEGQLVRDADKGGILSARILWAFSAAYRVLGDPEYLMAATLIKDYIIEYFYDNQFGGTYWSVDYLGNPKDTKKQFYAIGANMHEPPATSRRWIMPSSCLTASSNIR